jgi:RimJ/RimL family protein N-acetyltransferase
MIALKRFGEQDFTLLASWVDTAEMLMQFAGPALHFPLTDGQMAEALSDPKRHAFTAIDAHSGQMVGYGEVCRGETKTYLGRIIIDPTKRGSGYGASLVGRLIEYAFIRLDQAQVALNVFDWNTAAIRCYERAGFCVNPNLKAERTVNGEHWTALNMTLDRAAWQAHQLQPHAPGT